MDVPTQTISIKLRTKSDNSINNRDPFDVLVEVVGVAVGYIHCFINATPLPHQLGPTLRQSEVEDHRHETLYVEELHNCTQLMFIHVVVNKINVRT